MLIYLDNCCYSRPYDDQEDARIRLEAEAELVIQQKIKRGELQLATSDYLFFENGQKKNPGIRDHISKFMNDNLTVYIEKDNPDLPGLIDEINSTGIKHLDACHLASAIVAGCDYFITTDDRILKYQTDRIIIMNPFAFALEVK